MTRTIDTGQALVLVFGLICLLFTFFLDSYALFSKSPIFRITPPLKVAYLVFGALKLFLIYAIIKMVWGL
jgi:hypothetical protein